MMWTFVAPQPKSFCLTIIVDTSIPYRSKKILIIYWSVTLSSDVFPISPLPSTDNDSAKEKSSLGR